MDEKQGLLLINLGTPSDTTPKAIKQYLTEFLHDRHVVDLPPLLWYPILHGIVLPKRVPYIAKHYQKIEIDGSSPLLHHSRLLRNKLQARLPSHVVCELAMTYGEPSISLALEKLKTCKNITLLPLFPQYSTTTTQAVFDRVTQVAPTHLSTINLHSIRDYADHPSYINALYLQIKQAIEQQGLPEILLLSYHGIPLRYIHTRQEDYTVRCELTTQLLIEKCHENGITLPIQMTYQSKFGKGKWTEPNTSDVLKKLAIDGIRNVHVICPGFAVDCIETIYEIDDENREIFLNAGGENFYYIPALNDSDLQVNLLLDLIEFNN